MEHLEPPSPSPSSGPLVGRPQSTPPLPDNIVVLLPAPLLTPPPPPLLCTPSSYSLHALHSFPLHLSIPCVPLLPFRYPISLHLSLHAPTFLHFLLPSSLLSLYPSIYFCIHCTLFPGLANTVMFKIIQPYFLLLLQHSVAALQPYPPLPPCNPLVVSIG